MNRLKNKGYIIIISGPSGVGKGTVIQNVLNKLPNLKMAISACTRKQRDNEVDGVDYCFLSDSEFEQKIKTNQFLEWSEVHAHRYGTLKSEVDKYIENGYDLVLEIDIQGAQKIRNTTYRVISIFITPPTFETLISRLYGRNTDQKETIARRLSMAGKELASIGEYDYIVVNSDIETATEDIVNIIHHAKNEKATIG